MAALELAASWLQRGGCEVEEAEPPHFEEGAELWRQLVMDDMRRGMWPAVQAMGDHGTRSASKGYLAELAPLDRDGTLDALARRFAIMRDWSVFLDRYPVLLMPVCWQRQFPIDADTQGDDAVHRLLRAQSPLLGTAMLGLPGLAVPTGVAHGLPTGVQLVSTRFREDLALRAGEIVERAAGFSALEILAR